MYAYAYREQQLRKAGLTDEQIREQLTKETSRPPPAPAPTPPMSPIDAIIPTRAPSAYPKAGAPPTQEARLAWSGVELTQLQAAYEKARSPEAYERYKLFYEREYLPTHQRYAAEQKKIKEQRLKVFETELWRAGLTKDEIRTITTKLEYIEATSRTEEEAQKRFGEYMQHWDHVITTRTPRPSGIIEGELRAAESYEGFPAGPMHITERAWEQIGKPTTLGGRPVEITVQDISKYEDLFGKVRMKYVPPFYFAPGLETTITGKALLETRRAGEAALGAGDPFSYMAQSARAVGTEIAAGFVGAMEGVVAPFMGRPSPPTVFTGITKPKLMRKVAYEFPFYGLGGITGEYAQMLAAGKAISLTWKAAKTVVQTSFKAAVKYAPTTVKAELKLHPTISRVLGVKGEIMVRKGQRVFTELYAIKEPGTDLLEAQMRFKIVPKGAPRAMSLKDYLASFRRVTGQTISPSRLGGYEVSIGKRGGKGYIWLLKRTEIPPADKSLSWVGVQTRGDIFGPALKTAKGQFQLGEYVAKWAGEIRGDKAISVFFTKKGVIPADFLGGTRTYLEKMAGIPKGEAFRVHISPGPSGGESLIGRTMQKTGTFGSGQQLLLKTSPELQAAWGAAGDVFFPVEETTSWIWGGIGAGAGISLTSLLGRRTEAKAPTRLDVRVKQAQAQVQALTQTQAQAQISIQALVQSQAQAQAQTQIQAQTQAQIQAQAQITKLAQRTLTPEPTLAPIVPLLPFDLEARKLFARPKISRAKFKPFERWWPVGRIEKLFERAPKAKTQKIKDAFSGREQREMFRLPKIMIPEGRKQSRRKKRKR